MMATISKTSLMALLMAVTVSACAAQTDPSSDQHQQQMLREFVKVKMLDGLGYKEPPKIPSGPLKDRLGNLPGFLSVRSSGRRTKALTGTKLSRVIVFADLDSNGTCKGTGSGSENQTSVSFKLPTDPSLVHRAILQMKTGRRRRILRPEVGVSVCSCENGPAARCQQLPLTNSNSSGPEASMKSAKKGWSYFRLGCDWKSFVSGSSAADMRLHFLLDAKLGITERVRPTLVLEVAKEKAKAAVHSWRMKRTGQDLERWNATGEDRLAPKSCSRTSFWVDIKELGWSEWILSPQGFNFHYCEGHCKNGFESIVKGGSGLDYAKVLNAMIEKHKITNIRPCCTAGKRSPLTVVIVTDKNTVNRTNIPNFIVDECACIGFS